MTRWRSGCRARRDAGKRDAPQITDYLKTFDAADRYDGDGDGEFDEPRRLTSTTSRSFTPAAIRPQATHSRARTRSGATVGTYSNQIGAVGPDVDGAPSARRLEIGGRSGLVADRRPRDHIPDNPTGIWVGDYTIQPENGGLGVFAHEFAHDLGLPDLYDTSGNTGGAENSTAFWTLMSSGANIGDGGPDGIGDAPTNMGAWEKLQLGWLNYEVARRWSEVRAQGHGHWASTRSRRRRSSSSCRRTRTRTQLDLGAPTRHEGFLEHAWATRSTTP